MMDLSVVVQTWNRPERCGRCVAHLQKELAAATFNWELIIADDGSPQESRQISERFPCDRYFYLDKSEVKSTGDFLNRAFAATKYDHIFHVEDDWYVPDWGRPENLDRNAEEFLSAYNFMVPTATLLDGIHAANRMFNAQIKNLGQVRMRVPRARDLGWLKNFSPIGFKRERTIWPGTATALYKMYDKTEEGGSSYQYSGNPNIRRKSDWEFHPFPEDKDMWQLENHMASYYREFEIIAAQVLPGWFLHEDGGVRTKRMEGSFCNTPPG